MNATRICAIDDCDRLVWPGGGRGWCATHYRRWHRHGDPMHGGAVIRQHTTGVPCEFCARPAAARGMCENHYRRWRKWGDPFGGQIRIGVTPEQRFWSKIDKTDTCWLWTDAPNGAGYGTFSVGDEVRIMAHRYAWLLAGRELLPGMQLDHLCRVKLCVRPDHLEQVTAAENLARAREANRERMGSSR